MSDRQTPSTGSSPLARGLLGPHLPQLRQVTVQGSSPLARGLLPQGGRHHVARGIIPARAGFTDDAIPSSFEGWDHPRSRGVYMMRPTRSVIGVGSSPLARGLLRRRRDDALPARIIPARAGFTGEDSPRLLSESGSSPLARGLHGLRLVLGGRAGIIPARAGFTGWRPRARPGRRDHPRSRGVYVDRITGDAVRAGSSPLARGLRGPPAQPRAPPGIIPARAGFTAQLGAPKWISKDHPRSRGVYRVRGCACAREWGSSPLARGLPPPPTATAPGTGIIPARAGFT